MESIEKTAERILTHAVRLSASDIHILPRKEGPLIQFRIDNKLFPQDMLTLEESDRLISHLKFLASMDIGEKRRPQSGSITMVIDKKTIGLRLSTLPASFSESLVIRLIPQQNILPLEQLSLFSSTANKLMALLKHSHGMIIFTGPTGSGKTTTLYSLLHHAKEMINRNVITLEDPIENKSEQVLQVQINEKAGISYSVGLKAALRHDPDIIMVGEIRDAETAQIAVRAALTGHLILTTMHTRDAKGAIFRLLEFGVSWVEIQQTLIAVTAQRLLELKCPHCKGNDCTSACVSGGKKYKRASVYELLHGKGLAQVLKRARGEHAEYHYRELKDEIAKAVVMGYVTPDEYDRWVHEHETE
ncbi:competence type IV pilus ATPase ComGA [Peribacillus glennii]|uniref:Type II/IV secretion system protein n=1 Tax=Peribacillus glennii TaxID=2303991 RepID=A0A372LHY9_9BACI|nr:competence type IV pilus ATPase ComGA [Peribacillus glennii]RFU65689.1 type II/IV secretion system protein [Peribacillus glennii]